MLFSVHLDHNRNVTASKGPQMAFCLGAGGLFPSHFFWPSSVSKGTRSLLIKRTGNIRFGIWDCCCVNRLSDYRHGAAPFSGGAVKASLPLLNAFHLSLFSVPVPRAAGREEGQTGFHNELDGGAWRSGGQASDGLWHHQQITDPWNTATTTTNTATTNPGSSQTSTTNTAYTTSTATASSPAATAAAYGPSIPHSGQYAGASAYRGRG